ncbi:Non-specific lipid-transfer protein type 2 [Sesbania bispinosa]|nr:Non-specific lipid-transfer protein type 2 [Sesbania bispinosa]
MMKKVSGCGVGVNAVLLAVVALMILVEAIPMAEAVTCSPEELSPCLGTVSSFAPPSRTCCQKVREQRPCLCGYLQSPILRHYITAPGIRWVLSSCGFPSQLVTHPTFTCTL